MRITVVGSTGVLGRNVIPRLVEQRHEVVAIVRQRGQVEFLRRMRVEAILGDILNKDTLVQGTTDSDVVLHLATAIPKPGTLQDWTMNDRIRREGTRNLLDACVSNEVGKYIQQSIILLYGDYGHEIVNETARLKPSPYIQSAADMEAMVQASSLGWCILRGGLFYGPGTGRDTTWRQMAQEETLTIPGDGSQLLSLIHVVDMARAVVHAVESAPTGSIYNVVDDEPVTYRELYGYVAAQSDSVEPKSGGGNILPSLGCSNAKLKSELGWSPVYPTYRSGLIA